MGKSISSWKRFLTKNYDPEEKLKLAANSVTFTAITRQETCTVIRNDT